MPDHPPAAPAWLIEELAAHLTRAIESMAGEAPKTALAAHDLSEEELETGPDKFVWWEQTYSLGPDSQIWIGAAAETWREIGQQALHGAGIEDPDPETVRGTYLEIVTQALSGAASAASARVGKEVSSSGGREFPPPSSAGVACSSVQVMFGGVAVPLLVAFSSSWASLAAADLSTDLPATGRELAAKPPAVSNKPNSIDLLLDVELPVSVSFGRAQLPLKDVMKLTTGSIVELNRAVSEPVEVIVNNCVIARGEVVVVEGNFGIRIKEVISRQERLRTLN